MASLRALFVELGCTGVATYIQSGNLVCSALRRLEAETLAAALEARFGFAVPVVLRTLNEVRAVVAANPFVLGGGSAKHLHVVFTDAPLEPAVLARLAGMCLSEEKLFAKGRELFLCLPDGAGRSKLALACVAPKMPGSPTMRNWKTVLALQAMLEG